MNNLRFFCASHLQTLNHHCHDFEARFCCPKYAKRSREELGNIDLISVEDAKTKLQTFEKFKNSLPNDVNDLG